MAHQITIRDNGFAEMAFVGDRSKIWHGLGQELTPGASIEEWKRQAGLDWEVLESQVTFNIGDELKIFPDRKVLYRSDNGNALSIVSNDFKIVQPGEILEFFRDFVEENKMQLSTAGSLFGGKRFWALAETGKSYNVTEGDEIKGYLLLTTSVDGTLATTAKFISTRVVCNNTLSIAMNEKSSKVVRKTHKSIFDSKQIKIDLGLIDEGWERFIGKIKKLAEIEMTDEKALEFFQKLLFKKDIAANDQSWGVIKNVNDLMNRYKNGIGANMSYGTAWGVLNAVTERYTHGTGRSDPSYQFWNSFYGNDEAMKNKAFELLAEAA